MKTIRERLQELPPGYRERALANYQHKTDPQAHDMCDAINSAFRWASTPEGQTFWEEVYDHYSDLGSPLPKLPWKPRPAETFRLKPA